MRLLQLAAVFFMASVTLTRKIIIDGKWPIPLCVKPNSQSEQFVRRHILEDSFNTSDRVQWATLYTARNLWGRTNIQSFMKNLQAVEDICKTGERQPDSDIYMSNKRMTVYDVELTCDNNNCPITVCETEKPVKVACKKVRNLSYPVHYEPYEKIWSVKEYCRKKGFSNKPSIKCFDWNHGL